MGVDMGVEMGVDTGVAGCFFEFKCVLLLQKTVSKNKIE